jgi:hypothetical protein
LALVVRTIRYQHWPGGCLGPSAEQNELSRIGHSVALRGAFADPFVIATGPTAHHAPVYPLLLAAVYKWVPQKEWSHARVALNIALSSAVCAGALLAGLSFGLGEVASLLGSIMLAIFSSRLNVEICNDQEAGLVALVTIWSIWNSSALVHMTNPTPARLAWTGLVWGLALLAAPVLLLVSGCLILWLLVQRGFQSGLLIAAVAILVLVPWLIRDRVQMGGWVPIRDSMWLELRVSNDDRATADPSVNAETGAMQRYHPLFNMTAAERIRQYGELSEYERLKRDTLQWIISHPKRFIQLTVERFCNFWIPIGTSRIQRLYRLVLYFFSAIGLVLLHRSDSHSFLLSCMFIVIYPLPYYLVQSYSRYAYPMEWLVTLLAAYCVVRAIELIHSTWRDRRDHLAMRGVP